MLIKAEIVTARKSVLIHLAAVAETSIIIIVPRWLLGRKKQEKMMSGEKRDKRESETGEEGRQGEREQFVVI